MLIFHINKGAIISRSGALSLIAVLSLFQSKPAIINALYCIWNWLTIREKNAERLLIYLLLFKRYVGIFGSQSKLASYFIFCQQMILISELSHDSDIFYINPSRKKWPNLMVHSDFEIVDVCWQKELDYTPPDPIKCKLFIATEYITINTVI